LFEVEHLIYNPWCSQYKSVTDSYDSRISKIWTLIRNSKWTFDAEQFQQSLTLCKLLYESCICVSAYPNSRSSLLYIKVWKIRWKLQHIKKSRLKLDQNHQWSFVWYGYCPMKDQFQIHSKFGGTLVQA